MGSIINLEGWVSYENAVSGLPVIFSLATASSCSNYLNAVGIICQYLYLTLLNSELMHHQEGVVYMLVEQLLGSFQPIGLN